MNEHVTGETLAAYADGRLAVGPRSAAEAHLSRCRECREELAEIVEMLAGRETVPGEFLDRARKMTAGETPQRGKTPAARIVLLRPAFGIAAAFLVAVVAGYFFLGRGRLEAPRAVEKERPGPISKQKAPGAAARDEGPEAAVGGMNAAVSASPQKAAAETDAAGLGKGEKKRVAEAPLPAAPSGSQAAAGTAPVAAERFQEAGKAETAIAGEADGVVGGVEPAQEKDRLQEAKLASAREAPSQFRDLEAAPAARRRSPPARGGSGAASGALQLFLAASGRAAAPPSLEMIELAAGTLLRIAGDVSAADVMPPGLDDAWDWLPEGAALEVTIAADGAVTAVELLGEWRPGAATRARAAAAKLTFLPAQRQERRAVISRGRLN